MPPKSKFADGEQVLCFHGPLLYEAKCVKSEVSNKTMRYFVHYNGWNKNWDEWVPETRVLKANAEGLQRQKELLKAHAKNKSATKAASGTPKGASEKESPPVKEKEDVPETTPKSTKAGKMAKGSKKADKAEKEKEVEEEQPPTPTIEETKKTIAPELDRLDNIPLAELVKQRKRTSRVSEVNPETLSTIQMNQTPASTDQPKKKRAKVEATVESEDSFQAKIEVRIKIPDELKPWLVDDWDLVCRQKQLVQLPCKMTVDNILDDYAKSKSTKANNPHRDAVLEVTQGIREYFNVMLGTQLLYKFERPQYAEMLAKFPDLPMSQIYGATHILRFFVKLGGMLAYTPMEEKSLQLLLNHIHDFLKYVSRSANNLFSVDDYVVAPPEHHRKAV